VPVDLRTRLRERGKDLLMNRIRASAYELDKDGLRRFYKQVMRFRPAYLFGYTSLVYEFARFALEEDLDGTALQLKGAVTTSETLHDFQRAAIQAAFGCPVINEFGCTETGIIAFQCPQGGVHIPVETVYVEIQPEDMPDSPGLGRVIVSDLHNYAMPIIRYDIGDLAGWAETPCPCGRKLPALQHIVGRTSDIILTPDGRRLHTIIFYYILYRLESAGGGIRKFQVVREAPHHYDIKLVRGPHFSDRQLDAAKHTIAKHLGDRVRVRYRFVETIERTPAGKHRDFIDLTEKDAPGC